MSRKLLQRVIEEGNRSWRIKSVMGGGETVEQWAIPVELKADIDKYLNRKRTGIVQTKKGRYNADLIYDYIVDCIKEDGYPPTVREIRFDCEISSTSVVSYYLDKLEEEGLIKRKPFLARGITVM